MDQTVEQYQHSIVCKKKTKYYINENMKYYSAKYAYIHGGKQIQRKYS